MKNIIVIILELFMLISCQGQYTSKVVFPEAISRDISLLKETYLSIPLDMECNDSILFISDFRGDSLLWLYNIKNNDFLHRLAPFGEGPNNFLSPIEIKLSDSVLIIHNRWHYSLKKYYIDSEMQIQTKIAEINRLPTDMDRLHPLNDSTYIASGRFNEGRYAILDSKGKIVKYLGEYPAYFSGEADIPNFPKFMFHQTMFDSNSKGNKLACATTHVLDIMEYTKDSVNLSHRLFLSPYEYGFRQNEYSAQAIESTKNEIGVKRMYTTDNFIYLLYKPFTEKQFYELKSKSCEIWIFDWEGNAIKKLIINGDIITFCVDRDNNTIYCITDAPDPTIGKIIINN